MTFAAYEESRHSGEPVNLYLFQATDPAGNPIGPFAYTDAEADITFGGVTYESCPIDRDSITSAGTLDKTTLQIRMPQDSGVSNLFTVWPPTAVVSLIIRQGHANDPDDQFLVIWSGRVIGHATDGGSQATFTCEPITTGLKRVGLRRRWQYGCPHILYGDQCKANKAAATNSATIDSVLNSVQVQMVAGWNALAAEAKYVGGMMQWTTGGNQLVRRILKIAPHQVVTIDGPPTGLAGGSTVEVILGCNLMHGLFSANGDCKNLHNNILNFGGDPWIPKQNPFGLKNNYY